MNVAKFWQMMLHSIKQVAWFEKLCKEEASKNILLFLT